MASHREDSLEALSSSMAPIGILKESIVHQENSISPVNDVMTPAATLETKGISSRAYQLEMLEESIKGNIIVAMDTGSGKTQVAVLRIKHELEKASAPKLIWFLVPTVPLCSQQFNVLKSQISSVQIRSLTSADNVDRWTEKEEWDIVLAGVRIVISTYAVLYDALCHAFISMDLIALIVFDEAHRCVKRDVGSKIMDDFYWPRKKTQQCVPHILGLTASPVMGSKLRALETLELVLDSTCRTPRLQREELLLHVNRPSLTQIHFNSKEASRSVSSSTSSMASLRAVHRRLNILEDPEILRLETLNTEVSRNRVERALLSNKTFIQDQMNSFGRKAGEIYRELGAWAADFYISKVVSNYIESADTNGFTSGQWEDAEKRYLWNALRNVDVSPSNVSALSEDTISNKVRVLLNFLRSCDERTTGIIFVKERAIAYVLRCLLSKHAETSRRLRFETVIGGSQSSRGKRDIYEINNPTDALAKFRSGEINILIATSVLEEGIDVPKCQLVLCFDKPTNLKSYIQCRGRARLRGSRWVVLLEKSTEDLTKQWEELEREMKKKYEEEERQILRLADIEAREKKLYRSRQFKVLSTGALLDMESAKGHLQCFCSRLSSHLSVDMRPEYIILEGEVEGTDTVRNANQSIIRAKVILPPTLDSSLRVFEGRLSWGSEKSATKDAAFEAYVALYHAGLVNDHLLPLFPENLSRYMEKGDTIVSIQELFNPWPKVARAWKSKENLQQRILALKDQDGSVKCKMLMSIPGGLSDMGPILIHWNTSTGWLFDIGTPRYVPHSELTVDHTTTLLSLAYGHRWEVEDLENVVRFEAIQMDISQERNFFSHDEIMDNSVGLLRDVKKGGKPFLFHSWLSMKPAIRLIKYPHKEYEDFSADQAFVALDKWTRRSDFLHPIASEPQLTGRKYFSVLPQSMLTLDAVPTVFSQFGMLIPSILHKLEVQLIVEELCATILMGVEISKSSLVRTAISAPVAREEENYQKLEFLGDSVLKLLVCVFLASKHTYWPEGYLSSEKDAIISNSRLSRAAIDRGLDKFILLKPFTGSKWRPMYVDKLLEDEEEGSRECSSKTIADVVESLIGAGWKMGNLQTSLSIAKIFLPELELPSLEVGRTRLFDLAPTDVLLPPDLNELERLTGYCFQKKSLALQAVSHRSFNAAAASYERLEFLGDSILEFLIVTELMKYDDKLSHSFMHLYKTACVNGDYLGFIALEWKITQKRTDLKENIQNRKIEKVESSFSLPLWRFMRHGSSEVGSIQHEVERRHGSLRHEILNAIDSGTNYPWTLLASLGANKFYSDMVESLLAAVWVDSGSMDACKQLLDRMGIFRYLDRLVHGHVHVLHPREELSILAGDKEVKYEVEAQKMNDGTDGRSCKVYVGETLVCDDSLGISDEEVRTKGAERALPSLRFANGRSGIPVSYGERITRAHKGCL